MPNIGPQPLGLSDEQMKIVGSISLHWAHCDTTMALAIIAVCKMDEEITRSKVYFKPEKNKVLCLRKLKNLNKFSASAEKPIQEIEYPFKNYRSGRNLYVHGVCGHTEDRQLRMLSLRDVEETLDQLPLRFEQAKYVAFAGVQLIGTLGLWLNMDGSVPSEPFRSSWPDRPPV